MKKYRTFCFAALGALALSCLLAGCHAAQAQQPAGPAAAGSSISLPAGDAAAPAIVSDDPFLVKDVNDGEYDLAATPWGIKYPFMVDYYRELLREIRANGGDAEREANLCSGWFKTVVPDPCITAFGAPAVSLLGFDPQGEPDPDGPQLTTTIRSAVLEETTTLTPELLQTAYMEKPAGHGYLTVALMIGNTGSEAVAFTLNSIVPYVFVDGECAEAATSLTEMMAASGTDGNVDDSTFFHCTLAPGQSREYTVVFYADRRIELGDIYLKLNYPGQYLEPAPTGDPLVFTLSGTFCALK